MAEYFPPTSIWVLHPDREEGPQWRRCELTITPNLRERLYLHVKVRRTAGGANGGKLCDSRGFQACLDRIFEDMLRGANLLSEQDYRRNFLMTGSRGMGESRGRSPTLSFALPDEAVDMLKGLSNHDQILFHASIDRIVTREEGRRKMFPT